MTCVKFLWLYERGDYAIFIVYSVSEVLRGTESPLICLSHALCPLIDCDA